MSTTALGRLLRDLRLQHWPGRSVPQSRVAAALGVKTPSISAYENGAVPPQHRLLDYAVFFASPRWLEPGAPRRVSLDYLRPDERKTYDMLTARIEAAANTGDAPDSPFWRFPDTAPIRIFCGLLDPEEAGEYSNLNSHNYMRLRKVADLDSLFELWGNVRRLNPDSDVRFVLGRKDITAEDLSSHMVVLGNIAQRQGAGQLIPEKTLPVHQVRVEWLDGEPFELEQEGEIVQLTPSFDDEDKVVEDIGLIARLPNPHDSRQTLTVCSGVFTRGVYGAVRSLSDKRQRDDNAAFLRESVKDSNSFAVLFRVRVVGDTVVTPRLRDPDAVLHTFSPIGS
jgi:hypothetical protein